MKTATSTPIYARLHAEGLTLAQQNAVDLLASGKTDTEVAEILGLHRTTITKWRLYHPEFQAALNRVRAEIWSVGLDRLRSLIPAAVNVLAEAMGDPKNAERVKAATAILKLVPLTPETFAAGPGDAEEIVRRIVVDRRHKTPSRATILLDLMAGRETLEDECFRERVRLELRANGGNEEAPDGYDEEEQP
jgi:hypothetical protein